MQATVLGSDYPEALELPNKDCSSVWGTNFVGLVQTPRGSTVHSRGFPPGSRVASISAWSAATNKPYIACNTSHLLPIPPIGGVHLDAPEVGVVAAAYLPAFQALHHGQRQKRVYAYTPTALEGQRVLILAHGGKKTLGHWKQSLVDAQVQAAVRLALLAGARDVHVIVQKIGNSKKRIFGSDYRVRLMDTPSDDWVPILKARMDLILDYTNGSMMDAAKAVKTHKGRYVGCVSEDSGSPAIDSREEGPQSSKKSSWSDSFAFCQGGKNRCSSPLPEGKDLKHVVEWTAACISMKNASLFDFYYNWKEDRRLAEHDFNFLLGLLARRHIRPHVAMILDVEDFPTACAKKEQPRRPKAMSGAVVCEPWVSQTSDLDDISACSSISFK
jgi:NADPH:quinone reductase-like Zn-dependent oxidoreductase